jgi:hypothetical protein
MNQSRLYCIHENIKQRCGNPKNDNYAYYGGRGILICPAWLKFENFKEWAETSGYKEGLEIDRINNDGPYSPDNCRWTTRENQLRNTRHNVFLTLNDLTLCLRDWSNKLGILYETLQYRKKQGWSDEKTLTTPVAYKKKKEI